MKAHRQENRVVMVTGGAQGIGRGISMKLMEERYHVIVADRDEEAGREFAESYGKVFNVECASVDVSDWKEVREGFRAVAERHGRLDGLVNNAANADPYNYSIENLDQESWQRKMNANLGSVVACTKYAARLLKACRGSIVNIASTRAVMSEPDTEVYTASKGGVVALTHALANSLGPDVRVNAISPGWIEVSDWQKLSTRKVPDLREIDHRQHPAGRVGTPADVAGMAAYLISRRSEFVTGQNFIVDGGMTRKMIYEA